MKKILMSLLAANCLLLAACSNNMRDSSVPVAAAKNKISFHLPASQKWDLVSVEQDANGYAKSYRSLRAKGSALEQSFYINYGHHIQTPLLDSMHEVVHSLASTGCKQTHSTVIQAKQKMLIFSASTAGCANGRTVWQIFKVFNMQDGQYSIVYSANPQTVSGKTRDAMKNVVMNATISPL